MIKSQLILLLLAVFKTIIVRFYEEEAESKVPIMYLFFINVYSSCVEQFERLNRNENFLVF